MICREQEEEQQRSRIVGFGESGDELNPLQGFETIAPCAAVGGVHQRPVA